MKLLSWVHNKLSGSQSNSQSNIQPSDTNRTPISGALKEEFSDWPHEILSIGTLFNKTSKEQTDLHDNNPPASPNKTQELTSEEVKQLEKELKSLMPLSDIDCASSPRGKSTHSSDYTEGNNQDETDDDQHYTIVPNKSKDVCLDNISNNVISKKSLPFLLKKLFVCGVALPPTPGLREPNLSPRKTTMNKMLRAILRKKIYPQSPSTMGRKVYLKRTQSGKYNYGDENDDHYHIEGTDSIRWDKTDTEYIVLEI